jgi:hypothetical protein
LNGIVGTLDYYCHILNRYPNEWLLNLARKVTGQPHNCSYREYFEVQIHGSVDMRKDVAALVVPKGFASTKKFVEFQHKYHVELIFNKN